MRLRGVYNKKKKLCNIRKSNERYNRDDLLTGLKNVVPEYREYMTRGGRVIRKSKKAIIKALTKNAPNLVKSARFKNIKKSRNIIARKKLARLIGSHA